MKNLLKVVTVAVFLVVLFAVSASIAYAQGGTVSGDNVINSDQLERISWGAVLAGAVVALVIEMGMNLLGISIGMMSINPEYDEESASPKALGTGAIAWVVISAFIALFAGGWIAAHTAGMPDQTDGGLHGVIMWGVVTLVSLVLLSTAIGRLMSGVSTLIGHTLSLAADAAGAAANLTAGAVSAAAGLTASAAGTVANVAGSAAKGTAHAAQNVAETAADAAGDVASTAGHAAEDVGRRAFNMVQDIAPRTTAQAENMLQQAQDMISRAPEVLDAEELRDMAWQAIKQEAYRLMNQSNINPAEAEFQAREAADDAERAVRYAVSHPEDADAVMEWLLRRVLRRGESVVGDTDREAVIDALVERTGITREQAQEQLHAWESRYEEAKYQVQEARDRAMQRVEEVREEARERMEQVRREAEQRVENARREAEHTARQAAAKATRAVGQLAAAIVVAMIVSAFAAGLGGVLGAPDEEDVVIDVDEANNINDDLPVMVQ